MRSKNLSVISCFAIGVALIGVSFFIKNQVEEGNVKVSHAQKQVDQGNSLFSMNPASKAVGSEITGGAQKKINMGKEQIAFYEQVVTWTLIGGIAFLVIGTGMMFMRKKK